jgi:hypothetical protein
MVRVDSLARGHVTEIIGSPNALQHRIAVWKSGLKQGGAGNLVPYPTRPCTNPLVISSTHVAFRTPIRCLATSSLPRSITLKYS